MPLEPVEFVVGEAERAREVGRRIRDAFPSHERVPRPEACVYYDTWDGRIRRAGGALGLNGSAGRSVLTWTPGDGRRPLRAPVPAPPAFREDLPEGALREALAPLVEVRRLLPRVEVRRRRRVLDLVDEREKTIARAELREPEARLPSGAPRATSTGPLRATGARTAPERGWASGPVVLRLEPIRGYEPAFQRLRRFVEFDLRLPRREGSDVDEALALVGLSGAPAPSLEDVELDPERPAAEAARELFRVLFETLLAQVEGLRADLDVEFLHDLRVAVRRTRSLLKEVPGVLPEPVADHYAREFRWLGELTGPCRDLDVLRLALPGYTRSLDEEAAAAFAPVAGRIDELRAEQQRRVAKGLASKRFATLARNWTLLLRNGGAGSVHLPKAEEPIGRLAARRVRKRYRKVRAGCRDVGPEAPPERLHALRIQGKRLRYALELFGSLCEPERLARAVRALKKLQNALGDFNDLAVHAALLEETALALPVKGRAAAALATGRVLEHLCERRAAQRGHVQGRAAKLASKATRKRFDELFERAPR